MQENWALAKEINDDKNPYFQDAPKEPYQDREAVINYIVTLTHDYPVQLISARKNGLVRR